MWLELSYVAAVLLLGPGKMGRNDVKQVDGSLLGVPVAVMNAFTPSPCCAVHTTQLIELNQTNLVAFLMVLPW